MLQDNFLRQKEFWYKLAIFSSLLIAVFLTMEIWILLILSIAFAFILNPLVDLFTNFTIGERELHLPRVLAIIISFVVAAIIIALCIFLIAVPLLEEINHLVKNMPLINKALKEFILDIQHYLPPDVNNYINQYLNSMETYVVRLLNQIVKFILSFLSNAIQIIVVPVFTFYFLKDYLRIKTSIINILPQKSKEEVNQYLNELAHMLSAYVRGMFKLSCIAAVVLSAATYLMSIPYPLVLGLLAGISETLPIIGPIMSLIPAIILALIYAPDMPLRVALFYAIYYLIDSNVTVPKVMGDEINLHPIAIIFSLLIASKLFGILGMIFAVPATAFLKLSFEYIFMKDR